MQLNKHLQHNFEPKLLEELLSCPIIDLEKGTELRHESQSKVRYTPIVLQGSIRVTRINENGKEIRMYDINSGQTCFLNINAALNNDFGHIDSLKAVTIAPTKMISVTDGQIRLWHDAYKSWRDFVFRTQNLRFIEFFSIIDNVVFRSADDKLHEYLLRSKDTNNFVKVTHQEIAHQIGTAREVVSRLLKSLERQDKVVLSRGSIKVLKDFK